jgi:serine protease AprX
MINNFTRNMKKYYSFLFLAVILISLTIGSKPQFNKISTRVQNAVEYSNDSKLTVYVYLSDKGPDAESFLSNPLSLVTEKSLERRKKVLPPDKLVDITDVPLYAPYVNLVSSKVTKVRHQLKWFNCISVEATKTQLLDIANYEFVNYIDLVERYKISKSPETIIESDNPKISGNITDNPLVDSLNYGPSLRQDTMIKVNRVHNNGVFGQGVIVANFDAGYLNFNHEAFTTYPMKIIRKKDFQTGDTVTIASHSHGQATLSLVGGYKPGSLISPAFASKFILCRTEVDPTETPAEMDNWAAAAQWVDSLGADVITSSLGYLTFDAPYTSYTWQDMNGNTLLITKAADYAVYKGICVSNSAGNDGNNTSHNTLGGPADGDSVITIGALNTDGTRASYSSVGPTTDPPGRFKPDVMTQGTSNQVATQTGYSTFGSGTSWACPMAAGVMACMLSANKNLTPIQIRGILRKFASNNLNPNNLIGWGTIDAEKSVDSARKLDNSNPLISHTQPFTSTTNTGIISLKAKITDNGIIRYTRLNEAPRLYYRKNTGSGWSAYTSANFTTTNLDTFYFQIPGSVLGTTVQYYFAAQDIALPTPKMATLPGGGSGINPPGTTAPTTAFQFVVGTTSITETGSGLPKEFKLYTNYPNPFNPSTEIKFDLPKSTMVTLKIYDINGRMIKELVHQNLIAGSYRTTFDAAGLSSGVYFYQLLAGDFKAQNKMLLVK